MDAKGRSRRSRRSRPDDEGTRAEVAWSTLHGLATLQASGRLLASRAEARLALAHRLLTPRDEPH